MRVQYAFSVLRFEPDSSLADWFARRGEPWGELVTMGPAGFVGLNTQLHRNRHVHADHR
jgi:hypothetical protein